MTKIIGEDQRTALLPSRRELLQGAAATLAAARVGFPGGAFAQSSGPEVTKAILGYIALTDSAPLIIAKEKGLFAKHGLPDVEVIKQASWGAMRDNLVLGRRQQRHRRRAYSDAHALSDFDRQGDAEQRADADVCAGEIESRLPGNLRIERI